ncbi:Ig-like domain repeat protein [Candidatus Chlorohelix sp.]|uniref:Ig-like domain repeat protein n=1 Tax=Candidatus Chlorohelix sp. TaxID=3139201 RepID=UPI00302C456F
MKLPQHMGTKLGRKSRSRAYIFTIIPILVFISILSYVSTANNSTYAASSCSLDALKAVVATGGELDFNCDTDTSIILDGTQAIANDLTLTNTGAGKVIISGNNQYQIFYVNAEKSLSLTNLNLTGGYAEESGGAIHNYGTVTINNSSLYSNSAQTWGGAIHNDGGTVTISNSSLYSNSTQVWGGAITNWGTFTVSNSSLYNNTSNEGGAIDNGGTVTISNSSLYSNSATQNGGAIFNNTGTAMVTNTTFLNNSSGEGGAIYGTGNLRNSLLQGSRVCNGSITDLGYNLEANASGSYTCGFSGTSINTTDAKLDTPKDNGGVTLTIALLSGSSAINAIPVNNCVVTIDQRGVSRPQGTGCDIGAYEFVATNQLAFTTQPSGAIAGGAFTTQPIVTIQTANGSTDTSYTGTVTIAIKSGTGTTGAALGGIVTVNAVNGIATFTDLSIDKSGTNYQLLVSATGATSADSISFDVAPGAVPSITSINPATITVQPTNPIVVTVTGNGFIPSSLVRLNGTNLDTTYISSTTLSAVIPVAQLNTVSVLLFTVFNNTPVGITSNSMVFYVTSSVVEILSSSTASTAADQPTTIASANSTSGSVALEARGGSGTVSVAIFSSNPNGQAIFQSGTDFFDVNVAADSNFTAANLTFCNPREDKVAYWYDGTVWELASTQSYDAVTGCITVSVNASTSPSLSQLTGTYFGVGYMNTITALATESAQGIYGGTVTLKASLTANGQTLRGKVISFSLNGQVVCGNSLPACPTTNSDGVATLSNVSLIGISSGTYVSGVTASFAGNDSFVGSSNSNSLTVNPITTSTKFSSSVANPVYGQSVTFSATVTPAPNTLDAAVIFYLDGALQGTTVNLSNGVANFTPLNWLPVGSHTITVTFNGDTNYVTSADTITLVVSKAVTTLKLTSDSNPTIVGQLVTFTAEVSAAAPGDGTPTGSVTFSLDNNATTSISTLDSNGVATFSTDKLSIGNHMLTASYGGDVNYSTFTADLLSQVITNPTPGLGISNLKAAYGSTITLTAKLSSNRNGIKGKTVSFKLNGKAACNVSGMPICPTTGTNGVATLKLTLGSAAVKQAIGDLLPGNYPIVVQFAGDAAYPATSSSATLTVSKLTAKVTLGNLVQTYDGKAKSVSVTTSPANLAVVVTYSYDGRLVTNPTSAGWYLVTVTVNDPIYSGKAYGVLLINKAVATLKLEQTSLSQAYDGKPKKVGYTVTPNGLGLENQVVVLYNSLTTPPTKPGKYSVVVKLYSSNYAAPDVRGTLVVTAPTVGVSSSVLEEVMNFTAG